MTGFEIAFGVILLLGIGASLVMQMKRPQTVADVRDWSKEIAELKKDLEAERKEKNELIGKGREFYDRFKNLESDYKVIIKERDALQKSVTKFETSREQHEKDREREMSEFKAAKQAFKDEQQRVIADEAKAREIAEEERDRQWKEHEDSVISTLLELCKLPHLQFKSYNNNNLPDGFDGSLKPDFLIDFLGQYVVFDAKVSKAQNVQTYIDEQVKKTAEKMKKNDKIYPHIFLVVPTEAVRELKRLIYPKDHFYFYIVSRESLAPILTLLKRVTEYANFEEMEPHKRESMINFMAEMSTQINVTNATSLLTTKRGTEVLSRIQQTDPELAAEVEQKSKEKTLTAYSQNEIKRLASSLTTQNNEIMALASPKAAVKKNMIDAAQSVISQKLL